MLASSAIAPPEPTTLRGRLPSAGAAAGFAAHLAVTAWVFAPALFGGRMLYLRDISTYFFPNLVFLGRSLSAGVFPLWNPAADAGAPFLLVYPPDLILVALLGPSGALAAGAPLHMLVASLGATALARRLGMGGIAAWTSGLVFALSGFMVSAVNLVPLHEAAAWAPVVLLLALGCGVRPTGKAAALLAGALAFQVSTLAGEIVLQTALAGVLLLWRRATRRGAAALAAAAALGGLLSAPAWLGLAAIVKDTHRGAGFSAAEAVAGSLAPIELAAVALPRFFGSMHTLTSAGFWGQEFFLGGFPYLLTVYMGAAVLALAAAAGRDRLWLLVAIGVLLALGGNGPLGWALSALAFSRNPAKFMFLASLGTALLAGRGLDRAVGGRAPRRVLLPGLAVCASALVLWAAPEGVAAALAFLPALAGPAAQSVLRATWPAAFLASGVIALGAGAAAVRGGRLGAGAAALAVLDLLVVNADVNRFAPAAFYALRPDVRALLEAIPRDGAFRVFGYGIGNTPGLRFAPGLLRENSDVWLYYLDRQLLFGRTPVLDGLEGALDEDRTAWAPARSTLQPDERVPARFREIHARLRGANVRWVLSFAPLPVDLAVERGTLAMPEVLEPLRLWEIRDPLPRAFFALDPDAPEPGAAPRVEVTPRGPHEVHLRARTPPGYVVLLSGWDPGWQARSANGARVELRRAGERYLAIPTPGGEQTFHLRYRPWWWMPSLALAALGAALTAAALGAGRFRKTQADVEPAAARG